MVLEQVSLTWRISNAAIRATGSLPISCCDAIVSVSLLHSIAKATDFPRSVIITSVPFIARALCPIRVHYKCEISCGIYTLSRTKKWLVAHFGLKQVDQVHKTGDNRTRILCNTWLYFAILYDHVTEYPTNMFFISHKSRRCYDPEKTSYHFHFYWDFMRNTYKVQFSCSEYMLKIPLYYNTLLTPTIISSRLFSLHEDIVQHLNISLQSKCIRQDTSLGGNGIKPTVYTIFFPRYRLRLGPLEYTFSPTRYITEIFQIVLQDVWLIKMDAQIQVNYLPLRFEQANSQFFGCVRVQNVVGLSGWRYNSCKIKKTDSTKIATLHTFMFLGETAVHLGTEWLSRSLKWRSSSRESPSILT